MAGRLTGIEERISVARSEVEVAADSIWRLVERRVLPSDATSVRAAATALGISVDDVRLASIRLQRRGYKAPRVQATTTTERVDTVMQDAGRRRLSSRRERLRPDQTEGVHYCTRHDDGRGAWLPNSQFAVKDHRTGALKSMCRPCMTEYQRDRYLSVEKAGHLAELRFRLVAGDATVGDACGVCRELLEVGDEVLSRGALVHAACGQGVQP